jgi:hypothetical protein
MALPAYTNELVASFSTPSTWLSAVLSMTRDEHVNLLLGRSVKLSVFSESWTVVQVTPSTSTLTLKPPDSSTLPGGYRHGVVVRLGDSLVTRSPFSLSIRWSLTDTFGKVSGVFLEYDIDESWYRPTYEFARVVISE